VSGNIQIVEAFHTITFYGNEINVWKDEKNVLTFHTITFYGNK